MADQKTPTADTESDQPQVNETAPDIEPVVAQEMPADDIPPEDNAPKPAKPGFVPGVALGIIAAAIGYAAALFLPISGGAKPEVVDLAPIQAQIDDLRDKIAAAPAPDGVLKARVAELETKVKDMALIPDRVAALEQRPEGGADLAKLQQDILELQAQPAASDPTAAVQAAIAAELASVRQSAELMRADAQAAAQTAQRSANIALIRAALDTGAPFASVDMPDLPPVLADHAQTGLPSLPALKDAFPVAARLALEAALRADLGGSWGERVTNFLRNQTGARSLAPRDGDDPDAILSRAEAALMAADLPKALAEIQTLPAEAQAAMQYWTDRATLRQTAIDAVASLAAKKE